MRKLFLVLCLVVLLTGCNWDMKGEGRGGVDRDKGGNVTGVHADGTSSGHVEREDN
ncbi:MAG: lipoprotein [Candidatus Brocadiales bacterium]|nr:lipoprotein [Candidatus Bathyanammoxibius amoris]